MIQDWCFSLLLQAAEAPAPPGVPADSPAPSLFTGPGGMLVPMILVCVIIYMVILRPDSKKRKALELELKSLKKGDTVVTTGGLIGKVWRAEGPEVELLIDRDEQLKVRFRRSAIFEILRGEAATQTSSKEAKESA